MATKPVIDLDLRVHLILEFATTCLGIQYRHRVNAAQAWHRVGALLTVPEPLITYLLTDQRAGIWAPELVKGLLTMGHKAPSPPAQAEAQEAHDLLQGLLAAVPRAQRLTMLQNLTHVKQLVGGFENLEGHLSSTHRQTQQTQRDDENPIWVEVDVSVGKRPETPVVPLRTQVALHELIQVVKPDAKTERRWRTKLAPGRSAPGGITMFFDHDGTRYRFSRA